jgi:hypothetical protein
MGATRTSADVLHGRSPTHTSATAAARAAPVARAAEGARWRAHCEQQATPCRGAGRCCRVPGEGRCDQSVT